MAEKRIHAEASIKANERTLACGNGRSEEVKQVCVVGRGCSHWVMSRKVQYRRRKEFMEQPEGTQEHGKIGQSAIIKSVKIGQSVDVFIVISVATRISVFRL
jgi:hypothetical protein